MRLYHGTKAFFESFDPKYYHSGEGVGEFKGWYFCSNVDGAFAHCDRYLRCDTSSDEGVILVCEIPDKFVITDIESWQTETCYQPPIHGVHLCNSKEIRVAERISTKSVFEEKYSY